MKNFSALSLLAVVLTAAATVCDARKGGLGSLQQLLQESMVKSMQDQTSAPNCRADIVFVMDASTSIGNDDFERLKAAVRGIVGKVMTGPSNKASGIHVAGVYYNRYPRLSWNLQSSNTNDSIITEVNKLKYEGWEWGTCTGNALTMVLNEVKHQAGDVPDAKQRIVILISDGVQTWGKIRDVDAAQALKQANWQVYAIGVGKNINSQILDQIASDKDKNRANVDSYTDLVTQVNQMVAVSCDCPLNGDVVFLLDFSGSMKGEPFDDLKKAVYKLVEFLMPGDDGNAVSPMHIAAISFQGTATMQWNFDANNTRNSVLANVNRTQLITQDSRTCAGYAFIKARTELAHLSGTDENAPRVAIMIGDGQQSREGVCKNKDTVEAKALKDAGWTIFAIGVGKEVQTGILNKIASEGNEYRTDVGDFKNLVGKINEIVNSTCAGYRKLMNPDLTDLSGTNSNQTGDDDDDDDDK